MYIKNSIDKRKLMELDRFLDIVGSLGYSGCIGGQEKRRFLIVSKLEKSVLLYAKIYKKA